MIRFFCDVCGNQLKLRDGERLAGKFEKMDFEIITGLRSTWNAGNFCHDCVRAAVASTAKQATKRRKAKR